jgi:L-2-hydroxyglutarate oxidase LhgO
MQILVVGAGVVGLAAARTAARAGHEVIVAEKTGGIGNGVSSRNSEVLHGGMYYPTGSLRARHSVRGRRMLYAYCAARGVDTRKTGKLIVATNAAELAKVEQIHKQGMINEVEGLTMLGRDEVARREPEAACIAALWSPETGIIDSHGLMRALHGELEDHGGRVAFNTPIERIARAASGWEVHLGGAEPQSVQFDAVINCAGIGAQALARATEGYPAARVPKQVLAKGNYFVYPGRPAFKTLIYPVPVDGGIGIHVTLDLAGQMRFGPDVEWIERENYDVDPSRADAFYERIRSYWPTIPEGSLQPAYAGVRPKLTGPGEPTADFMIDRPQDHGLPGLAQLFGIESPGLTSSLSIAEEVVAAVAA